MTIREKTLFLTTLLLIGSLFLVFVVIRAIIIKEIEPQETRQVYDHVRIIAYLLTQKQQDLGKWIIDWANWDDSYRFMQTGSRKFITVDLSPSYFKVYDIEHLLFLLPDGQVRYACSYDFVDQTSHGMAPELLDKLKLIAALGEAKGKSGVTSGIFRSGDTFYVAATHRILTSNKMGPSRGMLVFVNALEKEELHRLSTVVAQPFDIMPIRDGRLSPRTRELLLSSPQNGHLERIISDTQAEGLSLFADILTGEKCVIRITEPRMFYAEGKRITNYFLGAILGIGALLITATLLLLNRTVLSPLKELSRKVTRLDFSQPNGLIDLPDGEELNNLAHGINNAMETLHQSRRDAEHANEAKGRFLAAITHELRTPLNVILGLSESLSERINGPLNERQTTAMGNIHESGRHLLSLINDILDLAKIEAGKLEIVRQRVVVEDICRTCITFMAAQAAKKAIELTYSGEHAPTIWYADIRRMKQILLNLLSNAIKFTPYGGSVVLDVTGNQNRTQIRFSVSDTGIGIDEEQQKRLFQPFTQIENRNSRHQEGTGLGLALVAQLTAMHHGRVSVESQPGVGSTFTVTLPWEEGNGASDLSSPAIEPDDSRDLDYPSGPSALDNPICRKDGHRPLILLAEDNKVAFDMVAAYLSGAGYRVIEARSGEEAVVRADAERPALVLMDLRLPDISGLEAIRRIRRLPGPTGTIPIIALTAQTLPEDRKECLAAGADHYLGKPVRLKELCRQIDLLLQQGRRPLETATARD